MNVCFLGAVAFVVARAEQVSARSLDRLNITYLCVHLVYILFVTRRQFDGYGWLQGRYLTAILHGYLGLLLGNARLSVVSYFLVYGLMAALQLLGHEICCSGELFQSWFQPQYFVYLELLIPLGIYVTCSILAWSKEASEYSWAGLMVQTQVAQQQEAIAKRLLSGMCDACVYLGHGLDIVEGAESLGRILGSGAGAGSRLTGRHFLQMVDDGEADRVANFFAGSASEMQAAPEQDTRRVSIQARLRDAFGVAVPVELFHACLDVGGEQVHVVGVKEEQDHFFAQAQRRRQTQTRSSEEGDADSAPGPAPSEQGREPSLSDTSSSSSSALSEQGAPVPMRALVPTWCSSREMSMVVDVIEDDYPTTCCSPALQILLGLQADGQTIPLASLFYDEQTELERFEEWADDVYATRQQTSEPMRLSFRNAGLQPLGIKMCASCHLETVDLKKVRLTFGAVSWEKAPKQARVTRPLRRDKRAEVIKSRGGTPRQQPRLAIESPERSALQRSTLERL